VPQIRITDAARFLGISDDTLRRWVSTGRITAEDDETGRRCVDGAELAALAQELSADLPDVPGSDSSARNRFVGLVTKVTADTVMAQVELQCGPFRVVSLLSSEAVRDLGLEPGSIAVASIKSTNVVVERLEGMP
jgi:molybdopterin-binding protein